MNGAPWAPSPPIWDALPAPLAESLREDYEERRAIMEFCGRMSCGLAEAAAYAFMFVAEPERAAVCAEPDEIERQTFRAEIIRRTLERADKAWRESFVPWVRSGG